MIISTRNLTRRWTGARVACSLTCSVRRRLLLIAAPGQLRRSTASQITMAVLHPNQFHVNEAWIAFHLTDAPVRTKSEGDFTCVALMDAASCFLLTSVFVSIEVGHPSKAEARQLLADGYAHKQEMPGTLFISSTLLANNLALEARNHDINIVQIPEQQLMVFIADAKEGFMKEFGKWNPQWPSSSKN